MILKKDYEKKIGDKKEDVSTNHPKTIVCGIIIGWVVLKIVGVLCDMGVLGGY